MSRPQEKDEYVDNIVADMQKLGLQYDKITCTSGGSRGIKIFLAAAVPAALSPPLSAAHHGRGPFGPCRLLG